MAEGAKQSEAGAVSFADGDFASLLSKEFRPRTEQAKSAVETAVKTLAQQALANTALISDDVVNSLQAMVAEIDKKLSEQVNLILHHADYQQRDHYGSDRDEQDEPAGSVAKVWVQELVEKLEHGERCAVEGVRLRGKIFGFRQLLLGETPRLFCVGQRGETGEHPRQRERVETGDHICPV